MVSELRGANLYCVLLHRVITVLRRQRWRIGEALFVTRSARVPGVDALWFKHPGGCRQLSLLRVISNGAVRWLEYGVGAKSHVEDD
jgi:hypothetical protein